MEQKPIEQKTMVPPPYPGPPYPVPPGVAPGGPGPSTGPSTTIIVTTAGAATIGPESVQMECRFCHKTMFTRVDYVSGNLAWIICGALCLFGCGLGCCLIPFCIKDMQDVEHRCSHCGNLLGIHQRKLM